MKHTFFVFVLTSSLLACGESRVDFSRVGTNLGTVTHQIVPAMSNEMNIRIGTEDVTLKLNKTIGEDNKVHFESPDLKEVSNLIEVYIPQKETKIKVSKMEIVENEIKPLRQGKTPLEAQVYMGIMVVQEAQKMIPIEAQFIESSEGQKFKILAALKTGNAKPIHEFVVEIEAGTSNIHIESQKAVSILKQTDGKTVVTMEFNKDRDANIEDMPGDILQDKHDDGVILKEPTAEADSRL